MPQLCQIVEIKNQLGMHARAAAKLVELVAHYKAKIVISHGDKSADADSVLGLLMLEAHQGELVEISANGNDAEYALQAICALIEDRFEEDI